jgi:plasmid stabilization system protein ParE
MPQRAWSEKRERQYEHIRDSLEDRGTAEKKAKSIAARTVNKERAQHGEAKESSPSSRRGPSPSRRGGLHSHTGPQGRTKAELYNDAKRHKIKGRSKMTKAELARAVGGAESHGR